MTVGRNAALSIVLVYPETIERDQKRSLMLFVHGLGSSKAIWFETAEYICSRDGYVCVLVDLRGHGESADAGLSEMNDECNEHFFTGKTRSPDATMIPSNNNYSLCRSADDLAIVIKTTLENLIEWTSNTELPRSKSADAMSDAATNVRRVIAVGHSYGGNLALELAVRHPSLVSDLILVDGGYIDLQGTFPDFNSCLIALRPPSFVGLEYSELERIVRSEWAMEGVKGSRNSTQAMIASPDSSVSELSAFSGDKEYSARKILSSVPPGCWSEQGIQGVLLNFRSVDLNTTTMAGAGTKQKLETVSSRSSKSKSIDSLGGSGRADDGHTGEHSQVNTIFSCVQTVLSFQRYILLLEDLWLKRPVDQFKALIAATRALSADPDSVLEKGKNGTISSFGEHIEPVSGDCDVLHSVLFIPAGAPSPFSSNKDRDIRVAIEALHDVSALSVLSVHPCVPVRCGIQEFILCGHNLPLEVPRELGDAIRTHLAEIHTHSTDSHTHPPSTPTHPLTIPTYPPTIPTLGP